MDKSVKINVYEVKGKIDYEKLINEFGVKPISKEIIEKIKVPFYMFERGIAFSHRDFDKFISVLDSKLSAIVCGRGPSENVHLGHLVPYLLVKYFHDNYNVKIYIPFSDDEKFYAKKITINDAKKFALENALDILALGFSPNKTKIVFDFKDMGKYYDKVAMFAKKITFNTIKGIFGFSESNNIGMIFYPAVQAVHILLPYFYEKIDNILVIVGIDQDPYMRLVRDLASEFNLPKPSSLYVKYLPPLTGIEGKMSASEPNSAIFLTDDEKTVKRKIMSAVTGGAKTLEEQKKHGGNPNICPIYYYFYYLCTDNNKVKKIYEDCKSGNRFCRECKLELIEFIIKFITNHKQKREKIRDYLEKYFI